MKNVNFYTEPRNGKISLWVEIDAQRWNITDLPKEQAAPSVLRAIAYAFERGYKAAEVERSNINMDWDIK
jgi:hypothetical protein